MHKARPLSGFGFRLSQASCGSGSSEDSVSGFAQAVKNRLSSPSWCVTEIIWPLSYSPLSRHSASGSSMCELMARRRDAEKDRDGVVKTKSSDRKKKKDDADADESSEDELERIQKEAAADALGKPLM